MKLFLFFGPPNVGKGSLVKKMTELYHIEPLSVGDICREEKRKNSLLWQEASAYMEATESTLWPTETLMQAFEHRFESIVKKSAGDLILDGFIRLSDQVEYFVRLVQSYSLHEVVVVDMRAPYDVCVKRALKRDREDDADIHRRLKEYHDSSIPALNHLMSYSAILPIQRINYNGEEDFIRMESFCQGMGLLYNLSPRFSRV